MYRVAKFRDCLSMRRKQREVQVQVEHIDENQHRLVRLVDIFQMHNRAIDRKFFCIPNIMKFLDHSALGQVQMPNWFSQFCQRFYATRKP